VLFKVYGRSCFVLRSENLSKIDNERLSSEQLELSIHNNVTVLGSRLKGLLFLRFRVFQNLTRI